MCSTRLIHTPYAWSLFWTPASPPVARPLHLFRSPTTWAASVCILVGAPFVVAKAMILPVPGLVVVLL